MISCINRQPTDAGAPGLLIDRLARQRLGKPLTSGALTVIPVYSDSTPADTAYRTLNQAIALGEVLITEQSQASVGGLRLLNHGALPVLILDGEEVVGGLQNRVVNTTLLIQANSKFDVPVSCIEHGRWHQTAAVFHTGEAVHPTLRRQKVQQVSVSLHGAEIPSADQHAIWAEVDARHRSTRTTSATAALRDAYVQRGSDLDSIVGKLACPTDGPCGVVACFDGHAVCADLFDRPETLREYWDRLVRSYALEALDCTPREVSPASAHRLLHRPARATLRPFASLGVGTDVRVTGNGVVGAALVYGSSVIHTSLFRDRHQDFPGAVESPRARARRIAGAEQS